MNQPAITPGTRLGSMLLDHVFMTVVMMIFFLPMLMAQFTPGSTPTQEQLTASLFEGNYRYLAVLAFALYLWKDSIGGRSLAKRITKLQLIDNVTGLPASPLQSVIRNITIIVWPVEALLAMLNPERRLGDRLAGTRLTVFDEAIPVPAPNPLQILLALVLSYALMFVILVPLNGGAALI